MDRDAQGSKESIIAEFNGFYPKAINNTSDEARYNVSYYFLFVPFFAAIISSVVVSKSTRHFKTVF